jgi:hypothetical protein
MCALSSGTQCQTRNGAGRLCAVIVNTQATQRGARHSSLRAKQRERITPILSIFVGVVSKNYWNGCAELFFRFFRILIATARIARAAVLNAQGVHSSFAPLRWIHVRSSHHAFAPPDRTTGHAAESPFGWHEESDFARRQARRDGSFSAEEQRLLIYSFSWGAHGSAK